MANKSFGTKQLDLTGASGSPIITSPSDLSINATTVAISTNVSVGGYFGSNVNVGTGYSIGIGTTIPSAELEVRGDIGLSGRLVNAGDSTSFVVKIDQGLQLLSTSGDQRLRILDDGSVLIGTSSGVTNTKLVVQGSGTTLLRVGNSDDGIAGMTLHNTGSSNWNIKNENAELRFEVSNDEKLRIDSDGKVGIGISDPSQQLHVYHATANEVARFESGDATSSITFKDSATTSSRPTIGAKTDDFFVQTGGSETFRIDSSGNVICQNANAYFAPPRITTNAMNNLTDMPGGAMIFNTNENKIYYYNNNTSTWTAL